MKRTVCCSAPGKVLITGGYMVLERPYSGLVLTVNARFFTVIDSGEGSLSEKSSTCTIEVISPQFANKSRYTFGYEPNFSLQPGSSDQKPNPYTERSILATLMVISTIISKERFSELIGKGLTITILGDNDFYSQRDQLIARDLPATSVSLASLPKFLNTLTTLQELKKTGLGSSAALVTSLVASLLKFFDVVKLGETPNDNELRLIHNLAQYCHCLAQGKIGSGFDVSSAVYGSQRYVRFSESTISSLLNIKDLSTISIPELSETVSKKWDNDVRRFALPKGFHLLLGDPSKGSNTPIMVSKVLKWKGESSQAPGVIANLTKCNSEVEHHIAEMTKLSTEKDYLSQIRECSKVPFSKWSSMNSKVADTLFQLRKSFENVRKYLQEMGNQASVEIEPQVQKELIDETMKIDGVLIAGVPGAGGYDAVFAILLDESVFTKVEELWVEKSVLPLVLREEPKGVSVDTPPVSSNL